jgi:hypothetical protein
MRFGRCTASSRASRTPRSASAWPTCSRWRRRFAAADALADCTALLLRELARPDAATIDGSSARFVRPSTVRLVHQRWDWDAWLAPARAASPTEASVESAAMESAEPSPAGSPSADATGPAERAVAFAVVSTSGGVRVQRLAPLAAAVLQALSEPASPTEAARRIAAEAEGVPAGANPRLVNAVAEQARQLYAAGMVDVV